MNTLKTKKTGENLKTVGKLGIQAMVAPKDSALFKKGDYLVKIGSYYLKICSKFTPCKFDTQTWEDKKNDWRYGTAERPLLMGTAIPTPIITRAKEYADVLSGRVKNKELLISIKDCSCQKPTTVVVEKGSIIAEKFGGALTQFAQQLSA